MDIKRIDIEQLKQHNIHYLNNKEMFNALIKVIKAYPISYGRLIKYDKSFENIKNWIIAQLSFLNNDNYVFNDYRIAECVYLIIHGFIDFPKCSICGNSLKHPKHFQNIYHGFALGCSKKCSSIQRIKSYTQTCLSIYGTTSHMKSKYGYESFCNKLEERYGVRNTFQLKSAIQAIKETKKRNHGDENFTNIELSRKHRYEKYNGKWESEETSQKRKQSFIKHYGVDNNMKSDIGKKEYEDAIERKFGKGIRNISQVDDVKKKKVETCRSHFGVDYPQQSPTIYKKSRKTCLNTYGYEYAMQSPEIKCKARTKYYYDNIYFDSLPEVALYIWLKDHNYKFEFHPNITFSYEYGGKHHMYQPDFRINNTLIEIKGDQFFKDDGTMCNPYNHEYDEIVEAKHQCMIRNNVLIFRTRHYMRFVRYIKSKYGNKFIRRLKTIVKSK